MRDYDAYLFDADGTIIDTRAMIEAAYMHLAENLGVPISRADVQNTIGMTVNEQMRFLLGSDRDDAYIEHAKNIYHDNLLDSYGVRLATFPGVPEGLAALKAKGKKMAVVTSRRRESLVRFLAALKLDGYFSLFVTPENTARHKPHPDPALFAAKALDVPAERCLFIGDATFDIECASAAGMDTALVKWGMDPTDWKVQPTYVIEDVANLIVN